MYLFISLKRSNDVWKNEMSNVHGLLVINIQTYLKKNHFTQKYHYKNIKQKPTQIRKIVWVRSKIDSRLS